MSDDGHTFWLDIEDGYVRLSVACPYDKADEMRPCWPHDETGPNGEMLPMDPPQEMCTYESWIDNETMEDLIHGSLSLRLHALPVWDAGLFTLELDQAQR